MLGKLRENLDLFSFRTNLKTLNQIDSIWFNRKKNTNFTFELSKHIIAFIFETQEESYLPFPWNRREEKSFPTSEHQCALHLVLQWWAVLWMRPLNISSCGFLGRKRYLGHGRHWRHYFSNKDVFSRILLTCTYKGHIYLKMKDFIALQNIPTFVIV